MSELHEVSKLHDRKLNISTHLSHSNRCNGMRDMSLKHCGYTPKALIRSNKHPEEKKNLFGLAKVIVGPSAK